MEQKKWLLTGITGMDASHCADILLNRGQKIYGMIRRTSTDNLWRLRYLNLLNNSNFTFCHGDLCDTSGINGIIKNIQPDYIIHLAAQSHVGYSFKNPLSTFDINANGSLRLFEAVRQFSPHSRIYNACTSECFGNAPCSENGYNEESPFYPASPYAISKISSFYSGKHYRDAYNLFICNGLVFNHSSFLRSPQFAFSRICQGAAQCYCGIVNNLPLGNIDTYRDIGYSPDYCNAFMLMVQQDIPDDYVIATGETHKIREICEIAFNYFGLNYQDYITQNESLLRPKDVQRLLGDSTKFRNKTGWIPQVTFEENIHKTCDFWLKREER